MANRRKLREPEGLSELQYAKLLEDLENFDNGFYKALAKADNFELVPTEIDGSPLTREQYALIKTECSRLGFKMIYQITHKNGSYILINPETLQVGYISENVH